MAEHFPQSLIAAARHHLSMGKKKALSPVASLNLAGEVLAVAAGLKPAFLYDYNSAGSSQLLGYVRQLETLSHMAHRLHLLSIAENILIINLETMLRLLETILTRDSVSFIDVSACRTCPSLCDAGDVTHIKGHISEILVHIKAVAAGTPKELSSSAIFSAEWNLCTVFGVLLGYPAAYSFRAQKSFDNCLSLTPLKVFTVQATFCQMSNDFRVRFYSFSIPEVLYPALKTHLNMWCENLEESFKAQKWFTDLSIATEVVTLAAVAL